jgi:surface polysaccharide O-acyltransferase-like enzyme
MGINMLFQKYFTEKQNNENHRYESFDLLKGIAIFLVVLYHYNNLNTDIINNPGIETYLNYSMRAFLSVCVPIFFFVNGALMLNMRFDLKKHIYKTMTIIVVSVIWAVITMLILMPIKGQFFSVLEIIKSIWELKIGWVNHLWFLQAIVVIYIFFPIIKVAYDNNIQVLYFFLAVIFIETFGNTLLINIASLSIGNKDGFNFFNGYNAFAGIRGYAIVYFIIGGLLFKYKERLLKYFIASFFIIPASIALLTVYGCIMSVDKVYDITWNGYDMIPTLFIVISLFTISIQYKSNKIGYLIETIGKDSLGVYLIHRFWGSAFINIFKQFNLHDIFSSVIFSLIILLLSFITVYIIKKIPIVNKLVTL